MNVASSMVLRERGLGINQGYDIQLLRLKCLYQDVYQGVASNPNTLDFNPNPPIFACEFSSAPGYEQTIALANEDGKLALQDISKKYDTQGPFDGTQAHHNAIFDIAWMPKELKLITASGDRSARLWDVSSDTKQLQEFSSHSNSIKCAVFRKEDKAVFATGGRDGAVLIWDIRANHTSQPRPDNSILKAHELTMPNKITQRKSTSRISKSSLGTQLQSVTALAFQDDYTLFSCSAGDGLIKAWDLRKNYTGYKKEPIAKHIMKYTGKSNIYNGFTSLSVCPAGLTLYASCVDKKIYAYNISSNDENPVAEYYGHGSDNEVLSFFVKACLSPDGEYLVSGSNDETAYIWRTKNPGYPKIKLSKHVDEVTCIAWCSVGETKIVTCSDDSYHRVWRVRPEKDDDDEKMNIAGCAELYRIPPSNSGKRVSSILDSPRATPCIRNSGSAKRSLVETLEELQSAKRQKTDLSPIQESSDLLPKQIRPNNRTPRKLSFSPIKRSRTDVQQPTSPQTPSSSKEPVPETFSPTLNLPNFVVDGTAPHLLQYSPLKVYKENVDWLTELRRKKCIDFSSKLAEESPSPKTRKTPTSRGSRSSSRDPKRTPKRPKVRVPSITNFYNNLSVDESNLH